MADAYDRVEVLEGPEVEIGPSDDEEVTDWECTTDIGGSEMSETDEQHQPVGLGPENNIYEVDMILDGPRKRKEHNFLVCYKIRWKNFGAEADSWQPLSDLENVMYMVDEYNQEKNATRRKKKKKTEKGVVDMSKLVEAPVNCASSSNGFDKNKKNSVSSQEESFSSVFGHLKDRFWKKLEMGMLDDQVFEGDMYSKVKGSRRAAHTDAADSIKKIQKKSSLPSETPKFSAASEDDSSSSRKRKHRKSALNLSSSSKSFSSSRSHSTGPRVSNLGSATKSRKRSSDPFSARGYMSAKRSRKSREHKRSTSSVTSVTVGIVSLNGDGTSSESLKPALSEADHSKEVQENSSDHRMESYPEASSSVTENNGSCNDTPMKDEVMDTKKVDSDVMTVTSETMLTVTTKHKRLEPEEVIQPEEIFKMKYDDWFLPDSTSLPENDLMDNVSTAAAAESQNSSAASGVNEWPNRSPFESMAEASGAVEKSYNDGLWGGDCNRSDCKSNRRWNMKNGKDEQRKDKSDREIEKNSSSSSSSPRASSSSSSSLSSASPQSSNQTAMPSPSKKPHTSTSSSSQQDKKSNFINMRSLEYDSSFDEPGPSTADKDAMSSGLMNALAHRMHADTIAGSNTRKNSLMANCSLPSERSIPQSTIGSNSNSSSSTSVRGADSNISERPGLFSDNNCAFNFLRETDPLSSTSIHASPAPSNTSSNSPGSINLSSPGKENFRSSTSGGLIANADSNNSSSVPSGASVPQNSNNSNVQEPVSSSSSVRVSHSNNFSSSPSDAWPSHRKRTGDVSGPLEKIPSPNSRRGSDLDRRIASISCDELEDMDTQGEDRFVKTTGFITNADLLQAVNLSKAEVVRRAIKQASDSNHILDFEQKDNTGITLLMRAVRRGSVAIVEMLLEKGVNVNSQTNNGMTPLMMACEQKEICLLALLLKYGANSSMCTSDTDQGETALMKAIKKQNKEAVNLMLRTGVNFAPPNCNGVSALDIAVERRNIEIEAVLRTHVDRLVSTFEDKVNETLQDTAHLVDKLFPIQCFPLRESQDFTVKFTCHANPLATGEGFLLFIAHTKINDRGVRCRFHGTCPIASVVLNGVTQTPLTREVNFVTSCHPIISGCNSLVISKHPDYTSKAKLMVCAYRARLLSHI